MGGTQHEKPVITASASQNVAALEARAQFRRNDADATRLLAQAYLDARQPGMAIVLVESSPSEVQQSPRVQHAYARALVDAGRSDEALAVEKRVVETCSALALADGGEGGERKAQAAAAAGCDPVLLASAMRRADILRELVSLGVEDAEAHPEASLVAYQNATREARVAVE
jgi:hypothetical protein